MLWKLDVFMSSEDGRETSTLLSPLESDWGQIFLRDPTEYVSPSLHLKTETDPNYETLCFVVI
jgi:hypothetical protein